MNRMMVVAIQEFLLKVRSRGFVIGTIATPLLLAAVFVLPAMFMNMSTDRAATVVIVDESGLLADPLERALTEEATKKTKPEQPLSGEQEQDRAKLTLLREPIADRPLETIVADLSKRVSSEEITGFLVLPKDALDGGECRYYALSVSDFRRNERMENAIETAVREVRIARSEIDPEVLKRLLDSPSLSTFKVGEGGEAAKDQGQTFMLAYIMGFLFYIMLTIYAAQMLRVVLEEKTSRSAEVIISIVRPSELVGGKLLANAAAALTQVTVWAVSSWVISAQMGGGGGLAAEIIDGLSSAGLSLGLVLLLGVYFLLGFLFYATLFGMVGAMVSNEEEAQQVQFPVTLPLIFASLVMLLAIRDPSGPMVQVLSFVPFFTPLLMAVRLCVLPPPLWEIVVTIVILVLSVAGVTWLSGRIFRVGLLMYGKRPNLPELIKWVRQG